jgi:hypothetical protein
MALDTTALNSRRALLAAALGGAAAFVAQALGKPLPSRAADGQAVVVGGEYSASSVTMFTNSTGNGSPALWGASTATGDGVHGESNSGNGVRAVSQTGTGLEAVSGDGAGVIGISDTDYGVDGFSSFGSAVHGANFATNQPAIIGRNFGSSTGVLGVSSLNQSIPPIPVKTGVYGYAVQDANARGVYGHTTAGQGVRGEATSGLGVRGFATSGAAASFEATTGWAIQSSGRVSFGKVSGVATIAAGTSTKTVVPGVDLSSTTFVLLTPRANLGTRALWYSVDTTANSFTIRVSSNVAGSAAIGWLVVG